MPIHHDNLRTLSHAELLTYKRLIESRLAQISEPVTSETERHMPRDTRNRINVVMQQDRKRYNQMLCAIDDEINHRA